MEIRKKSDGSDRIGSGESAFFEDRNWVAVASRRDSHGERIREKYEEESGAIRLDEWGQSRPRRFTS